MAGVEIDRRQNGVAVVRLAIMTAAGLLLSSIGLVVILWMPPAGAARDRSGGAAENAARL